jgi:hypothetical protein
MSFDAHEAQHFFTLMRYLFITHTVLFSFLFFIVIIVLMMNHRCNVNSSAKIDTKKGCMK